MVKGEEDGLARCESITKQKLGCLTQLLLPPASWPAVVRCLVALQAVRCYEAPSPLGLAARHHRCCATIPRRRQGMVLLCSSRRRHHHGPGGGHRPILRLAVGVGGAGPDTALGEREGRRCSWVEFMGQVVADSAVHQRCNEGITMMCGMHAVFAY